MKLKIVFTAVCILIAFMEHVNCNSQDYLFPLLKLFNLKSPTIINSPEENQVEIVKQLSKNNLFVAIKNDYDNINDETVIAICKNVEEYCITKFNKKLKKGLLVFENKHTLEKNAKKSTFDVDQEIYLLDESSLSFHEVYNVGDIKTFKKLGYLNMSNDSFFWIENIEQRFVNFAKLSSKSK